MRAKTIILLGALGILLGGLVLSTQFNQPQMKQEDLQSSALTKTIEMGVTELYVADKQIMTEFYRDLVGLEILEETETRTTLGFENRSIVTLVANPNLPFPSQGSAGLYHTAILFASRATLAQTVEHILTTDSSYFVGSSDHRVSEAFYFTDPEGNGLELYFDRDPETWHWEEGQIRMGSTYIDPAKYIENYGHISQSPAKKMGHVHLKVGDILQAKNFYVDTLGLKITAEVPGALFVSDGKYHHNLGLNVWESEGAVVRSESQGLKSVEILVAQESDLEKLRERLTQRGVEFEDVDATVRVADPWGNKIVIGVF